HNQTCEKRATFKYRFPLSNSIRLFTTSKTSQQAKTIKATENRIIISESPSKPSNSPQSLIKILAEAHNKTVNQNEDYCDAVPTLLNINPFTIPRRKSSLTLIRSNFSRGKDCTLTEYALKRKAQKSRRHKYMDIDGTAKVGGEVSFESYQDLEDSKLAVFIYDRNYDRIFTEHIDQSLKNLQSRECILEYVKDRTKTRICIESEWKAEEILHKYQKAEDGSLILKIAKPPLVYFNPEFRIKLQQTFDQVNKKILQEENDDRHEKSESEHFFVKLLAVILASGYTAATLAFMISIT
ncbi:hypothetical protein TSAR_016755, partial [Trichomalopsis sarcophagae]